MYADALVMSLQYTDTVVQNTRTAAILNKPDLLAWISLPILSHLMPPPLADFTSLDTLCI
jgi:hypothetical protein